LLTAEGKILIAEPRMHVTAEDLKRTLDIAQTCGLHCTAKPAIRFSHSALLGHNPNFEQASIGISRM